MATSLRQLIQWVKKMEWLNIEMVTEKLKSVSEDTGFIVRNKHSKQYQNFGTFSKTADSKIKTSKASP